MNGLGTVRWTNGKEIQGTWVNDKQEGKAKFINSNGEERIGTYENGEFKGWLK